ncbi:OST-HTH/LOTUS domain-containing protein [Sphingomonas sp. ZB1N12]|uniref:OST-HTH/LOTUS domain-containing protein n=1 Tax=Sphingomonas arabinosi TaxID=3096160 RepID=UPI002FC7FC80
MYTKNLGSLVTVAVPATADETVGEFTKATGLPLAAAAALIETALGQLEDQAEWYFLGAVGQRLITLTPDFDPRNYGCAKLILLIEKIDAFNVPAGRPQCLNPALRNAKIIAACALSGRVSGDPDNRHDG